MSECGYTKIMEEQLFVSANDMSALSELLNSNRLNETRSVICRPGTTDDVIKPEIEEEVGDDGGNHQGRRGYRVDIADDEAEKEKETEAAERYHSDPRTEAEYRWLERQSVTLEDAASISGFVFPNSGRRKSALIRIELPEEDSRTINIDFDLGGRLLVVFSHRYKLRTFLPRKVVDPNKEGGRKISWDEDKSRLEIVVRLA